MGTASDGRYPSWVVNWSRIIGNIGRTLIASGVLILLFVVYQLWGTALQERRAQDALRSQFAVVLAEAPGAASLAEFGNDELPARLDPEAVLTEPISNPRASSTERRLTWSSPKTSTSSTSSSDERLRTTAPSAASTRPNTTSRRRSRR